MGSDSFKNVIYKKCLENLYTIYIDKKDLALNDKELFICHKPNQIKIN